MNSHLLLLLAIPMLASASRCSLNPSFYEFKVGSFRGILVSDGPAIFDMNPFSAPDEAVSPSYRKNFRPSDPLVWQQNIAILDTRGGRLMVDAGSFNIPIFPMFNKAGRLILNLRAAGISPESIDAVLLTDAHPDHVSGIVKSDGSAAFPNARVYISRADHQFWTASGPNPTVNIPNDTYAGIVDTYRKSIAPYKKRLTLVPRGGSPLPGVRFVPASGHSPGHSAIQLKSGKEVLIITGDAWISKPDQLQNPEWGFFVETSSLEAHRSRIRLLSSAAKRRHLVLSYHEDFPGLGYISQSGPFFDWIPAPAQMLGIGIQKRC